MRRLTRLLKGWSEPPFWSLDRPPLIMSPLTGEKEMIDSDFVGYVEQAYKRNGIVFACMLARQLVFTEARFLFQQMSKGRPAELFPDASLRLLERPWPNGTTGELLARMEQDAGLAGNFYATAVGNGADRRVRRMRPDWCTIITGSPSDDPFDLEARPVGLIYEPRPASARRSKPVLLLARDVCHFSPIPDPLAQWRGMSWLTPVIREVQADSAATTHKLKFFENGATTNFVATYDASIGKDRFLEYVEAFKEAHEGVNNAYKTIHLGGGADVTTVGADMRQLDFKLTQGAGETRIAAASGLGAVMVQLSEGLAGSSLNAGNFGAARRRAADMFFRPMWRMAAASLESLVPPRDGTRLWYDDRDVAFLREDAGDAADIRQTDAATATMLIREGFTPTSVQKFMNAGGTDWTMLVHSGLVSVQLQPMVPPIVAPDAPTTAPDAGGGNGQQAAPVG